MSKEQGWLWIHSPPYCEGPQVQGPIALRLALLLILANEEVIKILCNVRTGRKHIQTQSPLNHFPIFSFLLQ